MKHTNKLVVGAAIAGILSGATAVQLHATTSPTNAGVTIQTIADDASKHDCKGKNSCKGAGGCKAGDQGCKGKNTCKGKGGCKTNS